MSIDPNLPIDVKFELYKLKSELQDKYITNMKQREIYYQSQHTYLLETLNAKLNGVNSSSVYVSSDNLSPIDLTPDFISSVVSGLTLQDLKGGITAVAHYLYKNLIFVDSGYAKKMIPSNKNGSMKYLVNGKVYNDVRLVLFTSLIHDSLLEKCLALFREEIDCSICLKTFMIVKNLKLNNTKFRKLISDFITEET